MFLLSPFITFVPRKKGLQIMNSLPEDPMILFSYINTKLRDNYASLDALCDDMHICKADLVDKLGSVGFEYNPVENKFW